MSWSKYWKLTVYCSTLSAPTVVANISKLGIINDSDVNIAVRNAHIRLDIGIFSVYVLDMLSPFP